MSSVPKGCTYGVIGRNGFGKSTLFKFKVVRAVDVFGHTSTTITLAHLPYRAS